MFRMLSICGILFGLVAAAPASAQTQKTSTCLDGTWTPISEEDIAARNLTARRDIFENAVKSVQLGSVAIRFIVTDCPLSGYVRRTILLHNGVNMGAGMSIPKTYGMYMTAAYLRNMSDEDDLRHDARQEACLIRTRVADEVQRGEGGEKSEYVRRCMLDEAVAAGETEYAKWLASGLGIPVPGKRSELDQSGTRIQERINQLKGVHGVPPGVIQKLEELRDSFKK